MAEEKKAAVKKPLTKKQLVEKVMADTGLARKDVLAVFASIDGVITDSMKKRGAGAFVLPGMLKIYKKRVPAKKARKNVKNPFTGELRDVPAKKAHDVIKIKPLKALKEMA